MQKTQQIQNNGHKEVEEAKIWDNMRLKRAAMDRFRRNSIAAGMDYSTYLIHLMDMEVWDTLSKDPKLRAATEFVVRSVISKVNENLIIEKL